MSDIEYAEKEYHPVIPWHYFRNGKPAHGKQLRALMRAVNTIQSRSRVIIPPMSWGLSSFQMTIPSDGVVARAVYPSSINGDVLCSRFVLHPTDDDTKSPTFKLIIDGESAIPIGKSSATLSHNVKCHSGYGATYIDRFVIDAEYEVAKNDLHEVELYAANKCRFGAWSLYEKEAATLTSSDEKIDSSKIAAGLPIVDTNLNTCVSLVRSIYDRQQGVVLNVNTQDGVDGIIRVNPAVHPDGTYLLKSRFSDSYETEDLYKFPSIAMLSSGGVYKYIYIAWVYGKIFSGSDPTTVQFIFNNIGSETIEVEVSSGTPSFYYSNSTEIEESNSDPHSIDVIANCPAGSVGAIYAFGLMKLNYSLE